MRRLPSCVGSSVGEFASERLEQLKWASPRGRLVKVLKQHCVIAWGIGLLVFAASVQSAQALDLDWSGQFRAEAHRVGNYTLSDTNTSTDPSRDDEGGYYVPGGGSSTSNFQSLFVRLQPKAIVNDNVTLKSEFWLGNPVFGVFGDAAPQTSDQQHYYSTFSSGSSFSAQRFWGEFTTDFGTVHVGRAPLQWGLGLVWNSGDGVWDRYQSTGDVIRAVSKFGAFSFIPSIVKYSAGNNLGGGAIGVSDYALALQYENPDQDMEGGVNFIRRIGGGSNGIFTGITPALDTVSTVGFNYTTWDIYGRKKLGKFSFAGEAPISSGTVGQFEYSTFAIALESGYQISESWDAHLKAGRAPGQAGSSSKYRAFYFHPNYRLGMIMFNYQLANFASNSTANASTDLKSPFDNPITNANYLSAGGQFQSDKWAFHGDVIFAQANEVAKAGETFFNSWTRTLQTNATGPAQSDSLGWEFDLGTSLQWDDNIQFKADLGFFFPGDFYKFSNTATDNAVSTVTAAVIGVGASF